MNTWFPKVINLLTSNNTVRKIKAEKLDAFYNCASTLISNQVSLGTFFFLLLPTQYWWHLDEIYSSFVAEGADSENCGGIRQRVWTPQQAEASPLQDGPDLWRWEDGLLSQHSGSRGEYVRESQRNHQYFAGMKRLWFYYLYWPYIVSTMYLWGWVKGKPLIIFIFALFIANKCSSFFHIIPILFNTIFLVLNECPNSLRKKKVWFNSSLSHF